MLKRPFSKTTLSEDFCKIALDRFGGNMDPLAVPKFVTVLVGGTSKALGEIKDKTIPKAIVFRSINKAFLLGAKIEYLPNEDNPSDPSAGRWDYTWTFYEDDLKGAECNSISNNTLLRSYYQEYGWSMFHASFNNDGIFIKSCLLFFELLKHWLTENATTDGVELELENVFSASALVNDEGEIELGMVPGSGMKILIKNDSMIQEN